MLKIVIIAPAWVGDMVMAQSLFKLLKQREPLAQLDVLAPAWSFPLLERMPEVSRTWMMPLQHGQLGLAERYRLGKKLREEKYDQAIILPNSFKSALIPYFAKIPVRTGWQGEWRFHVINDIRRLVKKRYPLMVQRFLALGLNASEVLPTHYPLPELHSTVLAQQAVLKKLAIHALRKPVLVLCPGAEYGAAKQWPSDYYAAVASQKIAEGWDVWMIGSAKDRLIADRIAQQAVMGCLNLAGQTSLGEAIDLLALATAVVSNDSGLMHVAAALQKPLVALYGPTSPDFTPPLSPHARVIKLDLACQPCFQRQCPLQHHRCLQDLKPQRVIQALADLV